MAKKIKDIPKKMSALEYRSLVQKGDIQTQDKKPRRHEESKLQKACVLWFKLDHPDKIIAAIPNGGARNPVEAGIMQGEGVLPGMPDLFIPEPRTIDGIFYCGLFIEMKFGRNGNNLAQKIIQPKLIERGYKVSVVNSLDKFMQVVNDYFIEK